MYVQEVSNKYQHLTCIGYYIWHVKVSMPLCFWGYLHWSENFSRRFKGWSHQRNWSFDSDLLATTITGLFLFSLLHCNVGSEDQAFLRVVLSPWAMEVHICAFANSKIIISSKSPNLSSLFLFCESLLAYFLSPDSP